MITRKQLHSIGASLLAASMIPWLFLGAYSSDDANKASPERAAHVVPDKGAVTVASVSD